MGKGLKFLLGVFILGSASIYAQQESPEKKAVFIIVDGITEDMLQEADTPNLDRIAEAGNYLKAYVGGIRGGYNETPTISAVGYNSLLTGTWFNKHGVFDNYDQDPNYNYPTIFRLFAEQYPKKKTAIFSTWEDNRTVLLGAGKPETEPLQLDYVFDGYEMDTLRFPHDSESNYIREIDEVVAENAVQTIQEHGPDLSWVYLQYTDDVAHRKGDGKALNAAISYEDDLIGKIYKAVASREKNKNEDWLLLITTDHGRQQDGRGHGGQSQRERNTWMVTNQSKMNEYAQSQRVAITDIFPTLAEHLNIDLPKNVRQEIDGVRLIGKTSIYNLSGEWKEDRLRLSWETTADAKGKGEIWYSTRNTYKDGGEDYFQPLGEVDAKDKYFETSLKMPQTHFIKILLKTENEVLNTWIVGEGS